jgi:hypothetical protein
MKRPPRLRQERYHGLRLPADLAKAITDLARQEHNSESAVMRRLLSLGLRQVQARERGAA